MHLMDIEQDIIKQIKKGNQSAFKSLVEEYQQYAFTLAFRILCDEAEARDAVQDSFIKIWQKIRTYDGKAKFTTWMYRIVTNTAIDRLRSIKRIRHINIDDVTDKLDALHQDDSSIKLENNELAQMIRFISEGLPEKQRLVFIMRDLQGLLTSEVQEILEMSESAIKSNLYHARREIGARLSEIISYERRTI